MSCEHFFSALDASVLEPTRRVGVTCATECGTLKATDKELTTEGTAQVQTKRDKKIVESPTPLLKHSCSNSCAFEIQARTACDSEHSYVEASKSTLAFHLRTFRRCSTLHRPRTPWFHKDFEFLRRLGSMPGDGTSVQQNTQKLCWDKTRSALSHQEQIKHADD